MSTYEFVKAIHITTAIISISGFVIRGLWMMRSSNLLKNKWVKIVPHINDTILLVAAIVLVVLSAQYPGPVAWINAKIVALLVYILLGTVALKRGKTMQIRIIAWVLAIIVFAYILIVAMEKTVFVL